MRLQVFERIRAVGRIPRVQVAKDLSVSPATLTSVTSELIEAGLLQEFTDWREGESVRGRPAVALGVRPEAGYVVGIKLADRVHLAVLLDFSGRVVAQVEVARQPGPTAAEELVASARRLLDAVAVRAGLDRDVLLAVGIALPGLVDGASGLVHWSPILDSREVNLRDLMAARLGLQVEIDNDANLMALAELWFGAGRDLSSFAVVTIEHGLGMGLVIDHRLYRGARGLGMELGHTKVQLDGALCRCGQRGCLEAYVADYALVREATTALNWSPREMMSVDVLLKSLRAQARAGNIGARTIFSRAGRYLALGLANVINLFDPEVIIVSGAQLRSDYPFAQETFAEVAALSMQTGRAVPRIELHESGDLLWVCGAAALALSVATQRRVLQGRDLTAEAN